MQHVVVIIPEDADVDVAKRVGQEDRRGGLERGQVASLRRFDLQNHYRDDDGDDAIGKCLKSPFGHHQFFSVWFCERGLSSIVTVRGTERTGGVVAGQMLSPPRKYRGVGP